MLDITRDPRWGRIEETYGEDAYLTAELGCAYVRGIQVDAATESVPSSPRASTWSVTGCPRVASTGARAHRRPRAPRRVPVPVRGRRARRGHRLDHARLRRRGRASPASASRELLTTILRERWGFDGVVVADYMGIEHVLTRHELVDDLSAAAGMALHAGLDMELPATAAFGSPLRSAVEDGRIDIALVDLAVERVLRLKFRLGLFEQPYAAPGPSPDAAREEKAGRPRAGAALDRAARERRHAAPAARHRDDRGHRPERGRRPQPRGRLRPHRAHRDAAREPRP